MSVQAKFFVREITQFSYSADNRKVVLSAVSRGTENKEWAAATPSGEITLNISNGVAAEQFQIGKEYLVTFTLDG